MSEVPPKRFESELTVVIDRDKLPPKPDLEPVSTVAGVTIEQLADVERARREAQDEIGTLVGCEWCAGCGMVTPEKAAYWRARYPELAPEEPPPSRTEAA